MASAGGGHAWTGTTACWAAGGGVEGVPPHAARSTAITAVTADKRVLMASLPGGVDHAMLANVERFAHGRLADAGGRAAAHHVKRAPHRDDAQSVTRGRSVRTAGPLGRRRIEAV